MTNNQNETPRHFIAVSNNHGWGKGPTIDAAIQIAVANSAGKRATLMGVWGCHSAAYVDGRGSVFRVLTARRRFERKGETRGAWKEVPDVEVTVDDGFTAEDEDDAMPVSRYP